MFLRLKHHLFIGARDKDLALDRLCIIALLKRLIVRLNIGQGCLFADSEIDLSIRKLQVTATLVYLLVLETTDLKWLFRLKAMREEGLWAR